MAKQATFDKLYPSDWSNPDAMEDALIDIFEFFDTDGDGFIELAVFRKIVEEQLGIAFSEDFIASDYRGVSVENYVQYVYDRAQRNRDSTLDQAFSVLSDKERGTVTAANLHKFMTMMDKSHEVTLAECETMCDLMNSNFDTEHEASRADFDTFMQKWHTVLNDPRNSDLLHLGVARNVSVFSNQRRRAAKGQSAAPTAGGSAMANTFAQAVTPVLKPNPEKMARFRSPPAAGGRRTAVME